MILAVKQLALQLRKELCRLEDEPEKSKALVSKHSNATLEED